MTNRAQSILPVILYVEDSEEAFIAVEYFLKKYYEVIGAKTVDTAISQLFANEVKLILMDINLKQPQDGIHLTMNLKGDERFKHIPVVALTAYSLEYKLDTIHKDVGFEEIIQKPVEKRELIARLVKYFDAAKPNINTKLLADI